MSSPSTSTVLRIAAAALTIVLAQAPLEAGAAVRLHGAVTMEKMVTAQKPAVETRGVQLEVVGNGSGRGLADLCGGLADVAMIGGSLKGVADATNKEKPGSVDLAGLKETPFIDIKVAFITHPSAGVKSISAAQLADVLSGKTKNWKEIGGADLPVKVVLPFAGDGVRISLQESILNGAEFTKDAILRNSAKDLAVVVAQVPGSCTCLTIKNVAGDVTNVAVDKNLVMGTSFVTKGDPAGDLKKALDAIQELCK